MLDSGAECENAFSPLLGCLRAVMCSSVRATVTVRLSDIQNMKIQNSMLLSAALVAGHMAAAHAQTVDPVASMEEKVARLDAFFATKPKLLYKFVNQDYSPTGASYKIKRMRIKTAGYDVVKTDSLVSPYTAYIMLDQTATTSNDPCGKMRISSIVAGWATSTEALAFQDKEECFPLQTAADYVDPVRLDFALQKNQWVLKRVTRIKHAMPDGLLSAVWLDVQSDNAVPVTDPDGQLFNSPWKAALQ